MSRLRVSLARVLSTVRSVLRIPAEEHTPLNPRADPRANDDQVVKPAIRAGLHQSPKQFHSLPLTTPQRQARPESVMVDSKAPGSRRSTIDRRRCPPMLPFLGSTTRRCAFRRVRRRPGTVGSAHMVHATTNFMSRPKNKTEPNSLCGRVSGRGARAPRSGRRLRNTTAVVTAAPGT